jgi:hypothetical protein
VHCWGVGGDTRTNSGPLSGCPTGAAGRRTANCVQRTNERDNRIAATSRTGEPSHPAHTNNPNTPDSEADSRVVALVLRAVAEVNEMLPDGSRLREDTSSPLVQPHGPLDSLGVINLLVAVENQVEAEFGRRPNLTEMEANPEDSSPLSTIGTLAKFVARFLRR